MDIVTMPQMGETVTEGTITAWLVAEGDVVEPDDALFEVSTEKVDTEVPALVGGHVRAILVAAGETVPVGVPVAITTEGPDDELGPVPAVDSTRTTARTDAPARISVVHEQGQPAAPSPAAALTAVFVDEGRSLSPAVRRLLAESGLEPGEVAGSGRDGRITRNDVRAAVARRQRADAAPDVAGPASSTAPGSGVAPVASDEDDEVIDFSRARAATAANLVRSVSTAVHALVVVEVDYSNVESTRRASGLTYLPYVARAVVEALETYPQLNASLGEERLIVHRRVNLGVAVDVDHEALVVPVVHDAQDLRLAALATALADLAAAARRRRSTAADLEGGTFTITNVGVHQTLVSAPIINHPQVAILSTDGVRMAPVAVRTDDGSTVAPAEWGVAIHPVGNLSLSFDHRALDGAYAAAFLARVREVLQTRDWSREARP